MEREGDYFLLTAVRRYLTTEELNIHLRSFRVVTLCYAQKSTNELWNIFKRLPSVICCKRNDRFKLHGSNQFTSFVTVQDVEKLKQNGLQDEKKESQSIRMSFGKHRA